MAWLPQPQPRGSADRRHPGPYLPGENQLSSPGDDPQVELVLPLATAEVLHSTLEDLLESGGDDAALERVYRILAWRILAAKEGTGLTAHMAELARQAGSVEEYEATRDKALGPILDALESAENRDP